VWRSHRADHRDRLDAVLSRLAYSAAASTIGKTVSSVGSLVLWWGIANWAPRIWHLNGVLDADPQLSAFPYRFRVLAVSDGTATVTSPRTPDMPAVRFLGILRPELASRREDDPAVVAAQQDLAALQGRARDLLLAAARGP